MSELAYQSGVAFPDAKYKGTKTLTKGAVQYRTFLAAVQAKDVQAAQAAFKGTAAWYWSADRKKPDVVTERQKHYLDLIARSIKGE
jgi:hypothetical protein